MIDTAEHYYTVLYCIKYLVNMYFLLISFEFSNAKSFVLSLPKKLVTSEVFLLCRWHSGTRRTPSSL